MRWPTAATLSLAAVAPTGATAASSGLGLLDRSFGCAYGSPRECGAALSHARKAAPVVVGDARVAGTGLDVEALATLGCSAGGGDVFGCRGILGCQASPSIAKVDCELRRVRFTTADDSSTPGEHGNCTFSLELWSAYKFEFCDLQAMCRELASPACEADAAALLSRSRGRGRPAIATWGHGGSTTATIGAAAGLLGCAAACSVGRTLLQRARRRPSLVPPALEQPPNRGRYSPVGSSMDVPARILGAAGGDLG